MAPSRALHGVFACLCLLLLSRGGLSLDSLNVASVCVKNDFEVPLNVSTKSSNCYKCLDVHVVNGTLKPGTNITLTVDTTFPFTIYLNFSKNDSASSKILLNSSVSYHFSAKASYEVLYNRTCHKWEVHQTEKGENTYLPILYATIVLVGLAVIWITLCYLYRVLTNSVKGQLGLLRSLSSYVHDKGYLRYLRVFNTNATDRLINRDLGVPKPETPPTTNYGTAHDESEPLVKKINTSLNSSLIAEGTSERSPRRSRTNGHLPGRTTTVGIMGADEHEKEKSSPKTSSTRLKSLDSFRGFSLVIMIFVNYGGGGYWFFNHSKWNGLTVADLVFPWFIWIMGVSIVFSYKGRKRDSLLNRAYQVFRRTIILFAIGLFLNVEDTPFHQWRIPGVLQRFSITYLVVAITELFTSELYTKWKFTIWKPIRDLTNNWVQWIVVLVLTFLWLTITFLLPLPHSCPRGYLGPGGLSDWGQYKECTGGAARVIDSWIFSDNHIYQNSTAKGLYQLKKPYEPEGVLGSLTSIVLCFLGVQAGRILTHYKGRHLGIIIRFILWGLALGVLGTILCLGTKNEGPIPINKNLWYMCNFHAILDSRISMMSLSFILVMGGTASIVFIFFYIMIDVLNFWNGSPFRYPGMNSIIVYVGHEVFADYFPFSWVGHRDSHLAFLSSNLVGTCMWMLIAYYWYLIGFFVKI